MRCSHNCQQRACTASNAHVRLQTIEYLNISGLVIDFATSPAGLVIAFLYYNWLQSTYISCTGAFDQSAHLANRAASMTKLSKRAAVDQLRNS